VLRESDAQYRQLVMALAYLTCARLASRIARNVRAIEVLLDRDAITNGQAAGGGSVRVVRARTRLLQLHLLRAMPAPDGERPLRLLPPQAIQPRQIGAITENAHSETNAASDEYRHSICARH